MNSRAYNGDRHAFSLPTTGQIFRATSWANRLLQVMAADDAMDIAVRELEVELDGMLVCITTKQSDFDFQVEAVGGSKGKSVQGIRLAHGDGLAGVASIRGEVAVTTDYARIGSPPGLNRQIVGVEGVRGAASHPLYASGQLVGFIFAGRRSEGAPSRGALRFLERFAAMLGPIVGARMQHHERQQVALNDLREAVATELHDEVIAPMFVIESLAKRISRTLNDIEGLTMIEDLAKDISRIEEVSAEIMGVLRSNLQFGGQPEGIELMQRLKAAERRYRLITGREVEFVSVGKPLPVEREVSDVFVAAAREALMNSAKHAGETSRALLCVTFGRGFIEMTVQDDGVGFPRNEFGEYSIPDDQPHFGLQQMKARVRRIGGDLQLNNNDDGGASVTLRVTHPAGKSANG